MLVIKPVAAALLAVLALAGHAAASPAPAPGAARSQQHHRLAARAHPTLSSGAAAAPSRSPPSASPASASHDGLSASTVPSGAASGSHASTRQPSAAPLRLPSSVSASSASSVSSAPSVHAHPSRRSSSATGALRSGPSPVGGALPRPTTQNQAQQACEQLPRVLLAGNGSVNVIDAFSQWYGSGANPSLEKLAKTYPSGWVPAGTDVPAILQGVGPDLDLTQEHGYGRGGQEPLITHNGPLGGLPAFCRLGAQIRTSPVTVVLTEVWLPMADEFAYHHKPTWDLPNWPIVRADWKDYPNRETPYEIDTWRAWPFLRRGWVSKYGNDTVYDQTNGKLRFHYTKSPSGGWLTWSLNPFPNAHRDKGGQAMMLDLANGQAERRGVASHSGRDVFGNGLSTAWNGRILFLANGGQRGWVPWADMKQLLSRDRFVVVGTNTGHFAKTGSSTWMIGSAEHKANAALDWTSRSTHVSNLLSRWVVDVYYGPSAGVRGGTSPSAPAKASSKRVRSYFAGCSVGGRNALASAQVNPGDFDGIFAGSPAVYFNRMNAGQLHMQSIFRKATAGKGFLSLSKHWAAVHNAVLKQCGNDEGIVEDPVNCAANILDLGKDLLCARFGAPAGSLYAHNAEQCLRPAQVTNLARMFQPTAVKSTQTGQSHTVYPAYLPGAERAPAVARGSEAKARSWFEYAVFNLTSVDKDWDAYGNLTWEDVERGQIQNVGGTNADDEDLTRFFSDPSRKLMHSHGLADLNVSPLASREYHDGVVAQSQHPYGDTGASYRYFEVPGMLHCRDGDGPWHFGSPTQNGPGNRPLKWDTDHDVLLRLVAWTEGLEDAPSYQVGAAYATLGGQTVGNAPAWSSNYGWGVRLTRKLCPYPSRAVYNGFGPTTGAGAHASYYCS